MWGGHVVGMGCGKGWDRESCCQGDLRKGFPILSPSSTKTKSNLVYYPTPSPPTPTPYLVVPCLRIYCPYSHGGSLLLLLPFPQRKIKSSVIPGRYNWCSLKGSALLF